MKAAIILAFATLGLASVFGKGGPGGGHGGSPGKGHGRLASFSQQSSTVPCVLRYLGYGIAAYLPISENYTAANN
ncbi:hypothetical protein QBC40DRAFT_258140 [Triangularia verruculosa]|uniref:Uncharacterized protein n=1 Tax=Triangularia verruculosa TaxID=2587418 RepID=A0AAN7AR46_9PEZI|nr:hypothetical protein QBC40DRAFT_258140 [Triangularia verruculosa]